MNNGVPWAPILWGGFFAVVLAASLFAVIRSFGWTRFDPTVQLGCLLLRQPGDPKTDTIGLILLLLFGTAVVPVAYWWIFQRWGGPAWGNGALLGLLHGAIAVLLLPALGMISACVRAGRLEAPGRYGFAYGWATPGALLVCHALYGAALGAILAAF